MTCPFSLSLLFFLSRDAFPTLSKGGTGSPCNLPNKLCSHRRSTRLIPGYAEQIVFQQRIAIIICTGKNCEHVNREEETLEREKLKTEVPGEGPAGANIPHP